MPGASAGEGLAYHSAAVASVLSQLARRAPALVEVAEDQSLWRQAFWACWLHDLGKAATGFQQVLRTSSRATWKHRHEVLSLAFLRWVTPPDADDFPWIAAAIASHHRDAPDILERYPPDSRPEDVDLDAMVAELDDESILGVAGWLRDKAPEWLNGSSFSALGVDAAWCGPRSVDPQVFRREAPAAILTALRAYEQLWQAHRAAAAPSGQRRHGVLLRGLLLLSDHLGSAHAPQLSPGIAIPGDAELLRRAGAPSPRVRSHQRGAAGTVGSVVLAAPTGSGKTEAALLWARRQCEDPGVVHRLVYLLPYQASLNAMHERLAHELLADVALVHGRAAQVLYRDLTSDGATSQQAERKARRAQDLARLHHPPVWVATPYQLLRAAYRLKQYETMWTALARNLIVVDEPHAYEPERLGLLLGLLRELVRAWDVRVCAMSATLPTWLRKLLVDSLAATLLPIDRALFAEFRRHRLALVPGEITEPATLATIVDQVRGGRSVLVAVNTVARAQLMRAALAEQLGPEHVSLLHSRFTGRDRLRKEQTVLAQLRAASPQSVEHAGLAVVATQVIEVSLDLDFDTIFSEPAPLEALAQRFGRVNRRGLKGVTPVHVLTAPKDGQHVYDPDLVQRTLKLLASVNGQTLDEALLSEYLDAVYAEDLANVFVRRVLASRMSSSEHASTSCGPSKATTASRSSSTHSSREPRCCLLPWRTTIAQHWKNRSWQRRHFWFPSPIDNGGRLARLLAGAGTCDCPLPRYRTIPSSGYSCPAGVILEIESVSAGVLLTATGGPTRHVTSRVPPRPESRAPSLAQTVRTPEAVKLSVAMSNFGQLLGTMHGKRVALFEPLPPRVRHLE